MKLYGREIKTQNSRDYLKKKNLKHEYLWQTVTRKPKHFLSNHCIRRKTPDKQMLLRQQSVRLCVCVEGERDGGRARQTGIKALWWVCVWLQRMANSLWEMTYEQNQAALLSISYIFLRESSKKKPGERETEETRQEWPSNCMSGLTAA